MAATNLRAAVEAHRIALLANDAAHDAHENRRPDMTSEELAPILAASDACFNAENAAWKELVACPCLTPADVDAKLSYLLDDERMRGWIADGVADPVALLQSLRLPVKVPAPKEASR